MNLTDMLTVRRICVPLTATTKVEAIEQLVDLLADNGDLLNRQAVLDAVLAREQTRSTGVGKGLALPHGKSAGVAKLVMAIGKCATPIAFDAVDGRDVGLIVLLVSPLDKTGPHIKALARVSRLMAGTEFRQRVEAADTAEELLALFTAEPPPAE